MCCERGAVLYAPVIECDYMLMTAMWSVLYNRHDNMYSQAHSTSRAARFTLAEISQLLAQQHTRKYRRIVHIVHTHAAHYYAIYLYVAKNQKPFLDFPYRGGYATLIARSVCVRIARVEHCTFT